MTKGIDISSHQGAVDWEAVEADFVMLRAGYGKSAAQEDKRFAENYRACTEKNIPVGAYWYSYAQTAADAEAEAQAAMEILHGKQFAYPIFFDMEDKTQLALSKTVMQDIAQRFCGILEQNQFFVGLYSYKSFLEQNFTETFLRRYAVWVAHTGIAQTTYRYPYGMWQYSHTGKVAGIRGAVDLDYAYADYPSIMVQKQRNGFAAKKVNPYVMPTRVLRLGSMGDDVRWMQWELTERGFSVGEAGIDGSFGRDTQAALLAFQQANALETDGICGPKTRAALE